MKRDFATALLGSVLAALLLLLPLKFGTLAVMTEAAGYFPPELWQWLFISYPAHALGLAGGVVLAVCVLILPAPALFSRAGGVALCWSLLLPLLALAGLGRGDAEVGIAQIAHLCGTGALLFAFYWFLAAHPRWKGCFRNVLCVSALLVGVSAFRQYFFGLEEMREFMASQYASGLPVSRMVRYKLDDPRVYATFTSSNALSAFALMLLVPVIFQCRRWAQRVDPVRVSCVLFTVLGGGLLLGTLLLTRSRSALLAGAVLLVAAVFSHPRISWKLRWSGVLAALLLLAGGVCWTLQAGRGLASMGERADYLRSCAVMAAERPLSGHGWGSFFFRHMEIKQSSTDEAARDPHNFAASFAAAAGLPAAGLVLGALLLPLILLWRDRFRAETAFAFWGGAGFLLHSCMDSDWQIAALPVLCGVLFLLALVPEEALPRPGRGERAFSLAAAGCLALASVALNGKLLRGEAAFAQLTERLQPTSTAVSPDLRSTEELFQEAVRRRPRAAVLAELYGDWKLSQYDYTEAERAYRKALTLMPHRPGTWRRLADLARRRGDAAEARRCMEQAHRLFPKNPAYFP